MYQSSCDIFGPSYLLCQGQSVLQASFWQNILHLSLCVVLQKKPANHDLFILITLHCHKVEGSLDDVRVRRNGEEDLLFVI